MQPINEDFLKFFCILKKRKNGGFDHYFNVKGNYWKQDEYLVSNGFGNWEELYAESEDTLEGFTACQMRPPYKLVPNRKTGILGVRADYTNPFEQWKFNFRHPPVHCPIPEWVDIVEIKNECVRLLPAWAKSHFIVEGEERCEAEMSIVSLGTSSVVQSGGILWAYSESSVIQEGNSDGLQTYLHDHSTGFVHLAAAAYDNSWVELEHAGTVEAFGSATVVLNQGPDGTFGSVLSYSEDVSVFVRKIGTKRMRGKRTQECDMIPIGHYSLSEKEPFPPKISAKEPFATSDSAN